MNCPACQNELLGQPRTCPACSFPLAELESAQLRLRITVVALAFSPLLLAALLPLVIKSAPPGPHALSALVYAIWGAAGLMGAGVILWPEPPASTRAEVAVHEAALQGMLAEGPALLAMIVYYLGVELANIAGLLIVTLLLFALLATRIPKYGAAVQAHMLEEWRLAHPVTETPARRTPPPLVP